jgi:Derlin-2/3
MAFAYTYSQVMRGVKINFFFVNMLAQWLPYAMLLVTMILGGWGAVISQGVGLVAAHLYEFLTTLYPTFGGGRNPIYTPAFIHRLFGTERMVSRGYGTALPARARDGGQASGGTSGGGWASGIAGGLANANPWSTRGRGHRLGGD